jgi:hypothetical protein
LRQAGFGDKAVNVPSEEIDWNVPLWKYLPLESEGFLPLPSLPALLKAFEDLMQVEKLIENSLSPSPLPPAYHRRLKELAILDTESEGENGHWKMTELGVVNVAYDPFEDRIAGILGEYEWKKGQPAKRLEQARTLLERAEHIIAHNMATADRPHIDRHLSGIPQHKWLCSWRGIDWKGLTGTGRESLEVLLPKFGLVTEQPHTALADARGLKSLLAQKHTNGRSFLGYLLDLEGAKS